jgi:hypothetical protein
MRLAGETGTFPAQYLSQVTSLFHRCSRLPVRTSQLTSGCHDLMNSVWELCLKPIGASPSVFCSLYLLFGFGNMYSQAGQRRFGIDVCFEPCRQLKRAPSHLPFVETSLSQVTCYSLVLFQDPRLFLALNRYASQSTVQTKDLG